MTQTKAIGTVFTAIATKQITPESFAGIIKSGNDTIAASAIQLASNTKGKKFIEDTKLTEANGNEVGIVEFLVHGLFARSLAVCAKLQISKIQEIKYTLPCQDHGNFLFYLIAESKTESSDNAVVQAIEILKTDNLDVLNFTSDAEKRTTAHQAAHHGRMSILKALLDAGVDSKVSTVDGWTLLTFALNGNHWPTCLMLLEQCKKIDGLEKYFETTKGKSYPNTIWGGDIFDDGQEHTIKEFITGKMSLKAGVKAIAEMAKIPHIDSDPGYIPDCVIDKSTEILGITYDLDGADGGL